MIVILVILLTLAVMILGVAQQNRMSPYNLILDSVKAAMIEKHGWSAERADAAETEYVRFLVLLQMRPRFMLVPWLDAEGRDDLDQFWHQHILDTKKYQDDCKDLFGKMIHHNPHVARGSTVEQESVDKTRRLYARTFSSGPYGTEADGADFAGCSACAATSSDSHSSHDGHGGDSGSHGGHSCGGSHSCGGHGCGHGCGSSCGGH